MTGLSPSAIAVLWVFGLFLLIGIVAVIGGASNNRATTPQTNTYSPSSSVPSDASPPPQPSQRSQLEAPAPAPTAEPNMVAAAAPSMAPEAPQQSAPIPENVERALAVRGYSGESELGASVVLKKGELLQVWLNDPAINYTEVKTGKGELLWVPDSYLNRVPATTQRIAPEAPQEPAPIPENVERALAVRDYSGESESGASVFLKKGELLQVLLPDPAINQTEVKTGKGELLWVSDLDIKRVP